MSGMDWIDVSEDRDRWQAIVNVGIFMTECLLSSQGLFSTELVTEHRLDKVSACLETLGSYDRAS